MTTFIKEVDMIKEIVISSLISFVIIYVVLYLEYGNYG